MRIASTPAGQMLIQMLQQNSGESLQAAMEKAAGGDFTQAKQLISALMNNPEARKLLEQLGR
jgi:uncharacterized protein with von Willebrand factor type A (vWA) domain